MNTAYTVKKGDSLEKIARLYNTSAENVAKANGLDAAAPSLTAGQSLQIPQSERNGGYVSSWQDEIDTLISNINNRGEFRYSINSDPLYSQYKAAYLDSAERASRSGAAAAAALTGGYGSSYAATAASQAYDENIKGLREAGAALYSDAYDRYRDETDAYLDRLAELRVLDSDEYERYYDNLTFEHEKKQDEIAYKQWQSEQALERERIRRELAVKEKNSAQTSSDAKTNAAKVFLASDATKYIDTLFKNGYTDTQIAGQLLNMYSDDDDFVRWSKKASLPGGSPLGTLLYGDSDTQGGTTPITPRLSGADWQAMYNSYYNVQNATGRSKYLTAQDIRLFSTYKNYRNYYNAVQRGDVK